MRIGCKSTRSCAAPAKAALSARRFASNVPSPNAAREAFRGGQLTCCDEKTYEMRLPRVGIDARKLECRLCAPSSGKSGQNLGQLRGKKRNRPAPGKHGPIWDGAGSFRGGSAKTSSRSRTPGTADCSGGRCRREAG